MTTGYEPPDAAEPSHGAEVAKPSRLQLARDILAVHTPRPALWRERCTTCRRRWPCPQAQWATEETARQPATPAAEKKLPGKLDVRFDALRAGRRDRWTHTKRARN